MKTALRGIKKLTKINQYLCFVGISTLLGTISTGKPCDWRVLLLLPANWLSVSVGYMINNIISAPDDALITSDSAQNPISVGLISPRQARIAAFVIALISLILYLVLGTWPLVFGGSILVVGALASPQRSTSKAGVMLQLLSRSLVLAVLPYMSGYLTFTEEFTQSWFWLLVFVLAVKLYGELDQLTTSKQEDTTRQISHTKTPLDKRTAHALMLIMLVMAVFAGAGALFIKALIPMWSAILILGLAIVISIPRVIKLSNGTGSLRMMGIFKNSLEAAAALGLFLQCIVPWLSQWLAIPPFWGLK